MNTFHSCKGWRVAALLTAVTVLSVCIALAMSPSSALARTTFASPPPPSIPNDDFASATVVPSLPFYDSLDITGATLQRGEPTPSCAAGGSMSRTVWYVGTPASAMTLRINDPAWFGNVVAVYTGSRLSRLTEVACLVDGRLDFQAEAGVTYRIQVGNLGDYSGWIDFSIIVPPPPPANDNFALPMSIEGLPFSNGGDNSAATLESGEPVPSCAQGYSAGYTLWYAFTPAEDIYIRVADTGWYGTFHAVYSGASLDGLTEMSCVRGGSATVKALAGTTYYIQAGSLWGNAGWLELTVNEAPAPPSNDNIADAVEIVSLPYGHQVDNSAATVEAAEPQPCSWYFSMERTVWYKYTPLKTGWLQVDPYGSNAPYATVQVYQGTGPGDLNSVGGCTYYGNQYNFQAQAGTTYYFQVGTIWSYSGTVQVNLKSLAPANDDFADALIVSSLPYDQDASARYASAEASEPAPSCNSGSASRTIWYAFTPEAAGSFTVFAGNVWFPKAVAIWQGTELNGLTEVGCTAGYYDVRLTRRLEAGTPYYVQVDQLYDGDGSLHFSLSATPPPQADFYYSPGDPNTFDNMWFSNNSYDPAYEGFGTTAWDFGDGTTSTDWSLNHVYAADGSYTVTLTVTTTDGRSATKTRVVTVETHDVAVVKLMAPTSAREGQSRDIGIELKNTRYPEEVQLQLFKSVPGGYQWVGTMNQNIPVRTGGRTTAVTMTYTFTADDAAMGKVTFRVTASLIGHRDVFPADNEAISAPTRVSR